GAVLLLFQIIQNGLQIVLEVALFETTNRHDHDRLCVIDNVTEFTACVFWIKPDPYGADSGGREKGDHRFGPRGRKQRDAIAFFYAAPSHRLGASVNQNDKFSVVYSLVFI